MDNPDLKSHLVFIENTREPLLQRQKLDEYKEKYKDEYEADYEFNDGSDPIAQLKRRMQLRFPEVEPYPTNHGDLSWAGYHGAACDCSRCESMYKYNYYNSYQGGKIELKNRETRLLRFADFPEDRARQEMEMYIDALELGLQDADAIIKHTPPADFHEATMQMMREDNLILNRWEREWIGKPEGESLTQEGFKVAKKIRDALNPPRGRGQGRGRSGRRGN